MWSIDSTWLLSCDMVDVLRGGLEEGSTSLVSSWFSCCVAVGIAIVGKLGGGAGSSWFASWFVVCGGKRTEVQRKRMGRATWVSFSLSATTTTTKEGEAWMEGKVNGKRKRRGSIEAMEKAKRMDRKRRLETKTMGREWNRMKGGRRRGEKTTPRVGKEWSERRETSRGKQNAIMGWTERQHGQIAKKHKGIKLTWIRRRYDGNERGKNKDRACPLPRPPFVGRAFPLTVRMHSMAVTAAHPTLVIVPRCPRSSRCRKKEVRNGKEREMASKWSRETHAIFGLFRSMRDGTYAQPIAARMCHHFVQEMDAFLGIRQERGRRKQWQEKQTSHAARKASLRTIGSFRAFATVSFWLGILCKLL